MSIKLDNPSLEAMAPKVPMDFGIENLYCQFHGNITIKLQGGEEMRANSLILSYHSSVFVHLFQELHQSELEMEDFSGDAVETFLGALYSGEIRLDRVLFRDVNKMCHVFKVYWLSDRCRNYYLSLLDSVTCSTDYETLLFLFEEARYCKKAIKCNPCNEFIDRVIQKICGMETNKSELFVGNYMKNYAGLETSQLNLMLQITKSNPLSLLKIIKRNIKQDGEPINSTSRHLLENLDLCKCMYDCGLCCEELYDALDHAKRSSKSDALFVNSVYRRVIKGLDKTQPCVNHKATSAQEQCKCVPPASLVVSDLAENIKREYQEFPVPYYPLKDNFYREKKTKCKEPRSPGPSFVTPGSFDISSLSPNRKRACENETSTEPDTSFLSKKIPSKKKNCTQPGSSGPTFRLTPATLDISSLVPKRKKASEGQTVTGPNTSFPSKKTRERARNIEQSSAMANLMKVTGDILEIGAEVYL